jgi:glycerophosphoryl diester phosphodiesterase
VRPIAHRGCLAQYPENTLDAFRRSAAAVEMIETDVQRCGSGELVVFHDETLDRVTDVTGEVASTPLSTLKEASVLGTDESIPLLTEAFEAVPSSVGLNLELKGADVAADAVEIAGRYDHEVIVSSFRPDQVADAREAGAAAVAYLLYADADATDEFDTSGALDVADDLDCSYVHPHVHLCLDTDIVERAHARGFGVNAWTAEGRETIAELRDLEVDGAVIDDCGLADECRDG